jgi:hypothetical protein
MQRALQSSNSQRRLGNTKSKLSGASPDEARAKIERLEQTLRLAIGSRWETLTADQSNRLFNAISAMQTRRIQIMFENPFGKELATSIADVFRRARWDVKLSTGAGFETGIGGRLEPVNCQSDHPCVRVGHATAATPYRQRDRGRLERFGNYWGWY